MRYHTAYLRSIGWESALIWQAEKYKSKFDSTEAAIRSQYEAWTRRFPNSATVAHAIGTAYYECESPKATSHLKRTVELDPRNAEAYLQLAIDAERWGNRNDAKEYMRLASVADTANPAYSFYYAMYFDEEDMKVFQTLIYRLADRFPAHERGAQGLYWLGYNIRDNAGKIKVWEDLHKRYDPQAFSWSTVSTSPTASPRPTGSCGPAAIRRPTRPSPASRRPATPRRRRRCPSSRPDWPTSPAIPTAPTPNSSASRPRRPPMRCRRPSMRMPPSSANPPDRYSPTSKPSAR
jgi:tetratricopeptide (TPR) repeat protein